MSLPKEVQKQEKLAEEIYKKNYEPQQEEPVVADTQPEKEDIKEPEQSPKGIQVTEQSEMIKKEPELTKEDNDIWQKKYQTLAGKYSAEVPRMAAEIKQLKNEQKIRDEEYKRLKDAPKKQSLITKEEEQEYGEGLINVVKKAAREEISDRDLTIASLKSEIESLKGVSAKTEEVGFYQYITNKHPDWQAINDDKDFHAWLESSDELTGRRRQDVLTEAENGRDAEKIANIFSSYKRTKNKASVVANRNLEQQVTPARTSPASAPPGKRLWTRAEIDRFYYDLRRGVISEKKAAAMENDIQSALMSGRIAQ